MACMIQAINLARFLHESCQVTNNAAVVRRTFKSRVHREFELLMKLDGCTNGFLRGSRASKLAGWVAKQPTWQFSLNL